MNLERLQEEQAEWALHNFGSSVPPWQPLLGIVEEVGELAHANLKQAQGIRGFDDPTVAHNAKVDAVGDIVIYLVDYCTREGIDLEAAVIETWEGVSKRDWVENPEDAHDQ